MKLTSKTPLPQNKKVKITFKNEIGEFFGMMEEDMKFHLENGGIFGCDWYYQVDEWEYA